MVKVFLFDYGSFIVEVLVFGEVEAGGKPPRVTARKGKAPLQYPPEDDEDYDDDEG